MNYIIRKLKQEEVNRIVLRNCLPYDNRASNFLAVDMDDLYISDDVSASFEKETAQSLRFSDVDEHGRIVNVRLYARVTGMLKG